MELEVNVYLYVVMRSRSVMFFLDIFKNNLILVRIEIFEFVELLLIGIVIMVIF